MNIKTIITPLSLAVASAIILTGCIAAENQQPVNSEHVVSKQNTVEEIHIKHDLNQQPVLSSQPATNELKKRKTQPVGVSAPLYARAIADLSRISVSQTLPDRENYNHFDGNPIKRVIENPVSTFSIDVDTGAYSNVRRLLNQGNLPREDAVRIEELVNYFSYDYPQPDDKQPFSVTTELSTTPWNKDTLLLHVGIQGKDIAKQTLPASNLVFLVDVSGSMRSANKLGLLKNSLKLLSKQLRSKDKVSLVVYAGASGVVLSPTAGNETATISLALNQLVAGGSTNGAAGIQLAYQLAEQSFIKEGINRVIIATDGDFNVGTTNVEALIDLIKEKRNQGVSLTTLGFGMGNYNDHLMEQLADAGNGNYAYIDTLNEAQKVLVDEMSSTLSTIANDVKIQIEFNPSRVAEYRLVGYENRILKREDFNNDKIDAGEIGAGHTVTALYEISLVGSKGQYADPLRYGMQQALLEKSTQQDELAFLRLRYKTPGVEKSTLIETPISKQLFQKDINKTSNNFRFSASVAAFGQQLRGADYLKNYSYSNILTLARNSRGNDPFGYRGDFLKLVNLAKSLDKH